MAALEAAKAAKQKAPLALAQWGATADRAMRDAEERAAWAVEEARRRSEEEKLPRDRRDTRKAVEEKGKREDAMRCDEE